jgi:hypothetical integral membrane protein (TIGR02206 family)
MFRVRQNHDWLHQFHPFTLTHACVVLVFLIFIAALVTLRHCDDVATVGPNRRFMDKSLGWIGLGGAMFVQISCLWPSAFDYRTALPLHICDLMMFIAPAALLIRLRPLRALAYFWGLGLSSLSFIYPDLKFGPGDFQFYVFWTGHAVIVGTALYDVTGRLYRPHWRDWVFAVTCVFVYAAGIFPIDAAFHLNYGYIGQSNHGMPTPFDALGGWPQRVPLMMLFAIAVMWLLLVPWLLARKWHLHCNPPDVAAGGGALPAKG